MATKQKSRNHQNDRREQSSVIVLDARVAATQQSQLPSNCVIVPMVVLAKPESIAKRK